MVVVLAESGGGMRKYAWAPGQNLVKLGGKWHGGWSCSCQGPDVWDTRCPGAWIQPNEMNSTGKRATPGQNSDEFVDGNCG